MTKRRLINKKAYEEILLLEELLPGDESNAYIVSIQVFHGKTESFVVDHYLNDEIKAQIVGENYTIISKMIIGYLSKL